MPMGGDNLGDDLGDDQGSDRGENYNFSNGQEINHKA